MKKHIIDGPGVWLDQVRSGSKTIEVKPTISDWQSVMYHDIIIVGNNKDQYLVSNKHHYSNLESCLKSQDVNKI